MWIMIFIFISVKLVIIPFYPPLNSHVNNLIPETLKCFFSSNDQPIEISFGLELYFSLFYDDA